jgi:cytochrome d ubiquinol oxidase subunit I
LQPRQPSAVARAEGRAMADFDAELLSRIQFAFVISFHIIFPAFTIGLAAWLATIETAHFITGKPVYRRVFEFWLEPFPIRWNRIGALVSCFYAFS